jgi:hypothetical protein
MARVSLMHRFVGGIGALVAVAAALSVAPPGVALLLAPVLLLFSVLLLGFIPGERLLERMRARRFPRRADRAPRTLTVRRVVVVRRIASLATSALAMRPPPALSALAS